MARIFKIPVVGFVPNPSAPTVTPAVAGATSYSYKLVGVDSAGHQTAASTAGSTSTGFATLSPTDNNGLTWTDPLNAVSILVYRTVGGTTQGLIATVAAGVQAFTDTGQAGDGSTPSAANGTGVGAGVECAALREKYVQFGGTFVSTNQLQGSIDGNNWVNEGSAVTTASVVAVNPSYVFVRNAQTAYTSGSVAITMCGHEE